MASSPADAAWEPKALNMDPHGGESTGSEGASIGSLGKAVQLAALPHVTTTGSPSRSQVSIAPRTSATERRTGAAAELLELTWGRNSSRYRVGPALRACSATNPARALPQP